MKIGRDAIIKKEFSVDADEEFFDIKPKIELDTSDTLVYDDDSSSFYDIPILSHDASQFATVKNEDASSYLIDHIKTCAVSPKKDISGIRTKRRGGRRFPSEAAKKLQQAGIACHLAIPIAKRPPRIKLLQKPTTEVAGSSITTTSSSSRQATTGPAVPSSLLPEELRLLFKGRPHYLAVLEEQQNHLNKMTHKVHDLRIQRNLYPGPSTPTAAGALLQHATVKPIFRNMEYNDNNTVVKQELTIDDVEFYDVKPKIEDSDDDDDTLISIDTIQLRPENAKQGISHLDKQKRIHDYMKDVNCREFSCSLCVYKTESRGWFLKHLKMHRKKKSYNCDMCNFETYHIGNFITHKKVHSGEKNFHCHVCDYKTHRKNDFKTHIAKHTREFNFCCHFCNYKTNCKDHFIQHKKVHYGGTSFCCDFCNYKTHRSDFLKSHTMIHNPEKTFQCVYCNFKTNHRKSYNRHTQMIHF